MPQKSVSMCEQDILLRMEEDRRCRHFRWLSTALTLVIVAVATTSAASHQDDRKLLFHEELDNEDALASWEVIDDVNNDGYPEIWCGDALHLWLFYLDMNDKWKVFARSGDLGLAVGTFNNIFPMKNGAGKTERVIVVSAGYVMDFTVDYTLLPDRS